MHDYEIKIQELKSELQKAKIIAEFAKDRELWFRNRRDQVLNVYQDLSKAKGKEEQYAVLLEAMKSIANFEHVCLLNKDKDGTEFEVIYASHPKLREHKWVNVGPLELALYNEIVVLSDPSIAKGFASSDYEFTQLTRSVIIVPLCLTGVDLVFVCTHHTPLSLNLQTKQEVKVFQSFLSEAVGGIEYRAQLEEAVKLRTAELIEYQEKQNYFHAISYDVYWQTDVNHVFVPLAWDSTLLKNRRGKSKFETPAYDAIVGRTFQSILDPDYVKEYVDRVEHLNNLITNHEPIYDAEFRVRIGNPVKIYWIRMNAEPLFVNGEWAGYMGISSNVTEEYKQYEDLQRAKDAAELANRSKSEYLAVMSHEIKTPLQAILGMLDLLEQTDIDEQQRSYIKHVSQSASLLQTILHDVLDLSRIESSSMMLEKISFDLHFLLNSSIVQMQEKAEAKGIELGLKIGDGVPKLIVGDQHRLAQIFFNLINNAIKFTSTGGVYLTAERFQNKLKFSVRDTGTGIPADHLEDLFRPFVQLDSSISRKYGGTGLGLAICKRLVEHMGGKIGIKSTLGVGSTFWFEIQCLIPSTPLIGAKAVRKPFEHKEHHYKILLVEDSHINQFVIKTMLEKLGHSVELASNGLEAIEQVKKKIPDLVFMDLRMPVMDGIEATKKILSEVAMVPIIALTANSSDEERIQCREAGMLDIASKPVTTAILKKLLEDLEDVIEETNANAKREGSVEFSSANKNIPLVGSRATSRGTGSPSMVEENNKEDPHNNPVGWVSSNKSKSNVVLIDALIKNKLGPNDNINAGSFSRTEDHEK